MKSLSFRPLVRTATCLGPVVSASCSDPPPDEHTGVSHEAILGAGEVSNPESTGHVRVGHGKEFAGGSFGSGTLLTNTRALASGHELDRSNCRHVPGANGNTRANCFFRAQSHYVATDNLGGANEQREFASRVSVHPRYWPQAPPGIAPIETGVDVAVVSVSDPDAFSVLGSPRSISALSPPAVATDVRCFGFGQETFNVDNSAGALRTAILPVTVSNSVPFPFFRTSVNALGETPYLGDSGGPCYAEADPDNIAGVIKDTLPVGSPDPVPTSMRAVAADAFRLWESLVAESVRDWNVDFDSDGIPDAAFLLRRPTAFGPFWAIKILTSSTSICPNNLCDFNLFPDVAGLAPSLDFLLGDFNNDGFPDVVGQIENVPFYLNSDPSNLGTFFDPLFAFVPNILYEKFVVGDFNEDTIPDLEAQDVDGFVDVYFGSGDGLQPGLLSFGFPTATGEDGRMATVSGKGLATVSFPDILYFIYLEAGRTTFDVHVFDGDQGGADDVPGGVTCFTLYANGNYDGTSGVQIATRSSDELKEHAWSKIYSGTTHSGLPSNSAQMPSGDFMYYLKVELREGSCAAPQENNLPAINSFMVRATADLWTQTSELSLFGWDSIGDSVPNDLGLFVARDNLYDGTFDLWFDVPPMTTKVLLTDADADDLDDAIDTEGPFGSQDVPSPGVANGANAEISYQVFRPDPQGPDFFQENVSGNNDFNGLPEDQDVEIHEVPIPPNTEGAWRWKWSNVLAGNNVHITVPESSFIAYPSPMSAQLVAQSVEGAPQLRLSAAPLRPLHWSTARTVDFWLANPDAIEPLLPISFGVNDGQMVVADVATALAILGEAAPEFGGASGTKVALCHAPSGNPAQAKTLVVGVAALSAHLAHGDTRGPTQALSALTAELMAAKLNIAGAAAGEDLGAALIYGTNLTVGGTVAATEGGVIDLSRVCDADATVTLTDMETLTRLLRGTNSAQVTNVRPRTTSSLLQALTASPPPSPQSGPAGYDM